MYMGFRGQLVPQHVTLNAIIHTKLLLLSLLTKNYKRGKK